MSDLLMNISTNDLQITAGDLSMARSDVAIRQNLQQTLQLWIGEWFLNITKGLPYRQLILVKNPQLDVIQSLFLRASSAVPGVVQITDFKYGYDNKTRTLSVSISGITTNGQTIKAQAQISATVAGG